MRVATIGSKDRSIHTSGIGAAKAALLTSDKTSLENGLYIIKNAKGQVLAAPIHENDNAGNNKLEWVTLDEQDPMHMPAYQFVITKTLSSATAQTTSPINVVNREFPIMRKICDNVQFRLNERG